MIVTYWSTLVTSSPTRIILSMCHIAQEYPTPSLNVNFSQFSTTSSELLAEGPAVISRVPHRRTRCMSALSLKR